MYENWDESSANGNWNNDSKNIPKTDSRNHRSFANYNVQQDWDESWGSTSTVIQSTEFRNQRKYDGRKRNDNFNQNKSRNWRDKSNDVNFDKIEVPNRFVGRIIGKGGSKISDLQFESGAYINVTKEVIDDNTVIRIRGSSEEIEKAKEMIQELTVDKPPRSQKSFNIPEVQPQFEGQPQSTSKPNYETIDWKALGDECDQIEKEFWDKQTPIIKAFYKEDPEVSRLTAEEVEHIRESNNNIVVSRVATLKAKDIAEEKPIPNPVQKFEQAFHNYPLILDEIKKAGFTKPSPIQCQAWPVLLSGDDLIGIAQTGTGKTLAFLLPALIHIDGQPSRGQQRDPNVLIMAPTRELALQIEREVKKYHYKGIKSLCIYGGGDRKEQINVVSNGVDIVIATPGRLNDLVQAGHISVRFVTYVVLDEADRMLDMGFEPQIRKVLYNVRPDRQTVMTSATWPLGVRRLADSYMINPVQIYVGSLDLAAVHTVTQIIIMLSDSEEDKFETFLEFARNMQDDEKVIVFCSKKARADYLSSELALNRILCDSIHGDREQCDRERALKDIADGSVRILIATDVASRGIDIEDLTHVINYDFPSHIEEYVHRVGRTGRAGRTGQSISYFTRNDWGHAKELIEILEEANQYVPEELFQMSKRFESWKERKEQENRGRGGNRRFGGRNRYGDNNKWY